MVSDDYASWARKLVLPNDVADHLQAFLIASR